LWSAQHSYPVTLLSSSGAFRHGSIVSVAIFEGSHCYGLLQAGRNSESCVLFSSDPIVLNFHDLKVVARIFFMQPAFLISALLLSLMQAIYGYCHCAI
jgi:hypothetical protein